MFSCNASSTFSGNITVATTAILKANKIRVNGSSSSDGVIISNTDVTEIAKLHNTTDVRLNGNTTILGSITSSGDVSVGGTLTITNFLQTKPWVGFLVTTSASPAGVATISKHVGYNTTGISVSHGDNGLYTFTIPAHPSGANYLLMLSPYSTSTTSSSTFPTGYGQTSTAAFAYCRNAIGGTTNVNGNFYVYTVP